MFEGLSSDNASNDGDRADAVFYMSQTGNRIPIRFGDVHFVLSPENTTVRMFPDDPEWCEFNRVMVDVGDGSTAAAKLEDDALRFMARCGFPVELPDKPDASDEEFLYRHKAASERD